MNRQRKSLPPTASFFSNFVKPQHLIRGRNRIISVCFLAVLTVLMAGLQPVASPDQGTLPTIDPAKFAGRKSGTGLYQNSTLYPLRRSLCPQQGGPNGQEGQDQGLDYTGTQKPH